jgi:hypothetical protein
VGVSASEGNEAANDSKVFVSSHLPHLAHYLSWGNEETRITGSFWDIIKDMANRLEELLQASRDRKNSTSEQEAQRRSFAYGNTHFENERITRETIDLAAEALQDAKNRYTAR